MTRCLRAAALVAAVSVAACHRGGAAEPGSASHDVDREAMDGPSTPGDDFFRYANGAWLKKAEIPADRSTYGVWSVLFDRAQQRHARAARARGGVRRRCIR